MSLFNSKNNFRNEQGVTLLLAIIILSSVLAISFSLATIMFIEVRTSGDLLKTEGALYAAGGVAEEALFNIRKGTCPQSGEGCTYTTNFSNNVKLSGTPVTSSIATPIIQDKVVVNSDFGSSGQKTYDFCNIGTQIGSGCGYGKVEITYLDTGSTNYIKVYLCEFDPDANYQGEVPCSDLNTLFDYWQNSDGNQLTENNNFLSLNLNTARQQVLIITNPPQTQYDSNVYFQIKTYDTDMNPKGLPYIGKTAVDINAINSSVGRKIRVIVPNGSEPTVSASPTDTVWVEDDIPTGGVCGSVAPDVCPWNKVSSNPVPFSGSFAFQSGIGAATHQMYFTSSTNRLTVNTGDVMVFYIYIDPANLPSEVMIQWNSVAQGWNHRAYWGANNIAWGTNGTQSRYQVSASVPTAGQWVRLTVPASSVGLEGQTIWGLAYALYGGRATWDYTGKTP